MSTEIVPQRAVDAGKPPVRIAIQDPGYVAGLDRKAAEALIGKARVAGKGLAEFARDLLIAGSK